MQEDLSKYGTKIYLTHFSETQKLSILSETSKEKIRKILKSVFSSLSSSGSEIDISPLGNFFSIMSEKNNFLKDVLSEKESKILENFGMKFITIDIEFLTVEEKENLIREIAGIFIHFGFLTSQDISSTSTSLNLRNLDEVAQRVGNILSTSK